ncbi:1254_t:CDS:2 [Paraglomus brasilianum]|uniref:1254_t:CDS:1 n=1 Tax=Paraglomus brasilianum TaxID=144538 RepID=A0A9N8Z202_9GLOM|nr:1254_t:CDS:2 [Paraglomus brasilianum]
MNQGLQQETALVTNFPNLDISRALATTKTTINDRIDALNNRIDTMETRLNARFDSMNTRNLARVLNLRITDPYETLEVVSNTTGNIPQNYPQTVAALRAMTRQNINALLNFYQLPNAGTVETKRIHFARHLEIQLL